MVIALQELIHADIPALLMDAISCFTCQDKDVETFLMNKAFEFERWDKSRTYLILDDDNGFHVLQMDENDKYLQMIRRL